MMDMKLQTKTKNRVGLDIGTFAIKMLEISGAPDKPMLIGMGLKNISGPSKGSISDSIKALADEAKITSREVNISVSGPSVIVRFISMPRMKEEDLKSAIRFEAEKFIPFNINDCVVDFQTLTKDERENKFNILLVAAKKEHIKERIDLVEEAGLSVHIVDIDSFAMTNAFTRNFPNLGSEKTAAILNIGATSTNLSIVRGDAMAFVRDVSIGSNDLNVTISKDSGLSMESAEELKIDPKDKMQEIANCTKTLLSSLLDEVKLSFGYYENQSGKSIDEIYISGGAIGLVGLDEAFQDALGSRPSFWNPLGFLDASSAKLDANVIDKIKNSFAVSAGLVLR